MNPMVAVTRGQERVGRKPKELQLLGMVAGMLAVLGVIVVGQFAYRRGQARVSVEASFQMKRSLVGVIANVDSRTNTFTLVYQSSPDPKIRSSNVLFWSVRTPPGANLQQQKNTAFFACYLTQDVQVSLSQLNPAPCDIVIMPGNTALVEYVVLDPEKEWMIAKTVIGSLPKGK